MKKVLSLILMSMLIIGALTACGTKEATKKTDEKTTGSEKKVLTMGTSGDYKPFEFVDTAKGEDIIGFDIDLAKAIAGKLGYEVKVQDIEFSGLIAALQSKQVDFVLSGMTPTKDRKKSVDFSDVYYVANHMFVSKEKNNFKKLDDIKGKTIGVQLGSIQEEKAKELAKTLNLKVENRNRIPELVQEVKAGRFDVAMIEDTVAAGYLKNNKDLTGFKVADDPDKAGSAIAFPKGSELTEKFNNELKKMKENGELDKLVKKWFSE